MSGKLLILEPERPLKVFQAEIAPETAIEVDAYKGIATGESAGRPPGRHRGSSRPHDRNCNYSRPKRRKHGGLLSLGLFPFGSSFLDKKKLKVVLKKWSVAPAFRTKSNELANKGTRVGQVGRDQSQNN